MVTSTQFGISVGLLASLTAGLVHLERTAPLAAKPSIRLRAMTGDLPAADLEGLLRAEEDRFHAAEAATTQTQRAKAAQGALGQELQQVLTNLESRVNERQAAQWSAVSP